MTASTSSKPAGSIEVDDSLPPPISNRRKTNFWFELDEETGTIYFQYNAVVASSGEESIAELAERLSEFVRTHEFERLIVDIRTNGGGGGGECLDLVRALRASPEINRDGRLFVLTAKQTYSAAVIFASMLQNSTKAIFVGEPTGQGPNFYGGPNMVKLPNSRLAFFVSTRLNETTFAEDERDRVTPDLRVGYRYLENKQYEESVKVFSLNVQLFPDSFNVHDSLGEAYMEKGDHEQAIRYYEQSLQLNPANTNAEKWLKKLKES
jgi:hypothetical protein